ncbi:MAG TPA: hypothetical protein VE843_15785 [Ktedonobacteraceae bacterium]|nr:hypothetical protein [Ktedonobacteraceae bacterium]
MVDSIPAYADFTQYNHIQSVRSADGAVIRARRVVADENTPIRWTMTVKDKMEQNLHIENTERGVRKYYSTSELVEFAQREGFGEWQQSKVGEKQGFALMNGEEREILIPEYQVPDTTPYLID